MCLHSRVILNPKYKPNKKNGGHVPPVLDERVMYVTIGCGDCLECRRQKARGWQVRMLEDIKANPGGKMVTLTFSNEAIKHLYELVQEDETKRRLEWWEQHKIGKSKGPNYKEKNPYELDNAIAKKGLRLFLERWRKKYKVSIRHWMVTELGHKGTENIHMHGIMWPGSNGMNEVERIWNSGKVPYGFIWKGYKRLGQWLNYVNERTVNYTVKYVSKMDKDHKHYKSIVLASPGIGGSYIERYAATLNKFKGEDTKETYKTNTGHEIAMPTYWRNKIYTEKEREALWLIKLDKMERWICGEKVDISEDEEEYYRLLKFHQERSKNLGYGNGMGNWSREQYELERRNLIQKARIDAATTIEYPKEWD